MHTEENGLFAVLGTVVNGVNLKGIGGLKVEAWDKDLICDDMLGSAVTNEDGTFQVWFNEEYFQELCVDRRPDVFFKVFNGEVLIKNTEEDVLWNMRSGDRNVVIKVDFAAGADLGVAMVDRIAISGLLLNKNNGYPLAGLTVRAFSVGTIEEGETIELDNNSPLAESISGPSGRFSLSVDDLESSVTGFVLVCNDSNGSAMFTSARYSLSKPVENLILLLPMEVSSIDLAVWQALAECVEQTRIVQLHELVRQLCGAGSGSTFFQNLSMGVRMAVITELEYAFLDPKRILRSHAAAPSFKDLNSSTSLNEYLQHFEPYLVELDVKKAIDGLVGKLNAFSSLLEVDWVMDIDALKKGDTNLAVNKFSDLYMVSAADELSVGFEPGPEVHLLVPTELSRYRDYLRTIFTGPEDTEKYLHFRDTLKRRFHQNFETLDTQTRPANAILIGILKDILVSLPDENYGFGFLSEAIETQGQRSDREYLDYLIGTTNLSAIELGLRYRLDFERSDSVMSNEVQENISTLQRFYSDGFQSVNDPFSIIPEHLLGKAPFFLYYEEWIQQNKPFHPENYLDYRRLFIQFPDDSAKEEARGRAEANANRNPGYYTKNYHKGWKWFGLLMALQDKIEAAHKSYEQAEYTIAYNLYKEANSLAKEVVFLNGMPNDSRHWNEDVNYDDFCNNYLSTLEYYKNYSIEEIADIDHFINRPIVVSARDAWEWFILDIRIFDKWLIDRWVSLYLDAFNCYLYELPLCLGDTALALGNYSEASKHYSSVSSFAIAAAKVNDSGYLGSGRGYDYWKENRNVEINNDFDLIIEMFADGRIPYSVYKGEPETGWIASVMEFGISKLNPAIVRAARLRHGSALLEWADALYRSDEESNIQRARELYKAVLFLHNKRPPIDPAWTDKMVVPHLGRHSENPALTLQTTHALRGYYQIEAGLNYFGANEYMVPTLHYETLKSSADRFAESAKAAQQDFLFYTASLEKLLEEAIRERLVTASALKKAALLGQIASEQIAIAKQGVKKAEQQVTDVLAAIQAKQDEINDSEKFLNQVVDFGKGFNDALEGIGQDPKKTYSAFMSGSAGGIMAGYALFIYGSYTSMSSMVDAYNSRQDEVDALCYRALPTAREQVKVREREVKIAQLQQKIAQSDAEFAMALAEAIRDFQQNRFLSTELWAKLAAVMKRIMRRYIELGVRYAWLAERALAYEQDRTVNIIRFDYFPLSLQGVTGADLLKLDLAELEASRLENIKLTLPVKKTYSLAFDYPLQFAQLKKSGRCSFSTEELPLRQMYPGFYGYRIHTIGLWVQMTGAMPQAVGFLKNDGISAVSRIDGDQYVLRREQESFPISEFRLSDDRELYGLPDDTLFAFEGSGVETTWTLELPEDANSKGLKDVSDILFTLNMRAHYSSDVYQRHISEKSTSAQRLMLFSARNLQPDILEALQQGATTVTFSFDLQAVGLPKNEIQREIKNLMIFLASRDESEIQATIKSTMLQNGVSFSFNQGLAMSNAGPLHSSLVTSELDQFIDKDATQGFEITINVADNPGVDFTGVRDMVFGIEYLAKY